MKRMQVLGALWIVLVAAGAQGQIQQSFFGMGAVSGADLPRVSYGTLAHPPMAWTMIEGTGRGVFDFSKIDPFVYGAPQDANGVAQIDLSLAWTPSWAVADQSKCAVQSSGMVGCTIPPDNMEDWANFITALVGHYNGINAPHVRYYEIWNEANTSPFWTASIKKLIAMAEMAYPILKSDPYSYVLTPSVIWAQGQGKTFMASYLSGGGALVADGVSFHGYPSRTGKGSKLPVPLPESAASTNAPIQNMVPAFRQVADTNGMLGKPLVTTEGGWGVNGVSDADMQAAWITHYEIVQAGLAARNNLQFQTWFTWGHALSGTIETAAGNPNRAGHSYQTVVGWLVGKTASPCTNVGTIWKCGVAADLIVWDTSQTCASGACTTWPFTVPIGYGHYVDLAGTVHTILNGTIALGVKPVMLEP